VYTWKNKNQTFWVCNEQNWACSSSLFKFTDYQVNFIILLLR